MLKVIVWTVLGFFAAAGTYNAAVSALMDRSDAKAERNAAGTLKGAEPVYLEGNSGKAVLLVHGFIGSPSDFGGLAKTLNARGYTVKALLLPGHGTTPRDFAKTAGEELERAVSEEYLALKKDHSEVTLVGLSMGGALGILTAARTPVDRLVLLAPYLKIKHRWFYVLPAEWYGAMMRKIVPYVYSPVMFKQVNRKEAIAEIVDYDFVPLEGARTCIGIGGRALEASRSLGQPTLIVHARGDMATDYRYSERLAAELSKKTECRLVTLEKTNHLVLVDLEKEAVEKEIVDFIEEPSTLNRKGRAYAR